MTNSQTALKGQDLCDRVVDAGAILVQNDIKRHQLTAEAKALLNTSQDNAFFAHMTLGILSCFGEKVDDMRHHHEAAINLDPANYVVINNFSTSLSRAGYKEEAISLCEKSIEKNQLIFTDLLAKYYLSLGRIDKASHWLSVYNSLNPDTPHSLDSRISRFHYFAEKMCIDYDAMEQMVSTAIDEMHSHKVFYHSPVHSINHDEYSEWISFKLCINRSVGEIVDLNMAIADRFAGMDIPSKTSSSFVVHFTKLNVDEH